MKGKLGYYDQLVRACARHAGRIAVRHYTSGEYRMYTYSELYGVCEYVSQIIQLLECRRGIVGIITARNPLILCIIAAVHKNSPTFMFLDPVKDNSCLMRSIDFKTIIIMHEVDQFIDIMKKKPDKVICVFNIIVEFYKLGDSSDAPSKNNFSYIVQTSGSTGEPKNVQVPIQCLQPNIDDLSKLFEVCCDDVVYMSTPLTFDPSMVEMLVACENGASLLVAPLDADVLCPPHPSPHALTIWQTTPSNFFQFSRTDICSKILSVISKLRVLAFGGEPMNHIRQLKELKANGNKTRIYCLYGVTEMSCWASVSELRIDPRQPSSTDDVEVPLGNCLSETELKVSYEKDEGRLGNILLGSCSRKCTVLNKSVQHAEFGDKHWIQTGDVGEVKSGSVYFRGRMDEVIKRFGHKVNLQMVEKAAMLHSQVASCSCLWLPELRTVLLFYTTELLSADQLRIFIRSQLDPTHWPDRIIKIESLPLNKHGKVCKDKLTAMYTAEQDENSLDFIRNIVRDEIRSSLKHDLIYEDIKDKDFFSIGGSSFLAMTLCNKLAGFYPQITLTLMTSLLTSKNTMEDFISIVFKNISSQENQISTCSFKEKKRKQSSNNHLAQGYSKKMLSIILNELKVEQVWSFDTGKCVDATPTLYKTFKTSYVIVGSHSGKVVVLNTTNGKIAGILKLNSRIEATVFCFGNGSLKDDTHGVVGTYDGTIVCFTISDCAISWKININSMIKSKATLANGMLYVASYDGNVRAIDFKNGDIRNISKVGDHGISADLVSAADRVVLTGTLGGLCIALDAHSNTILWRHNLPTPVFASPLLYQQDEQVIFAEVGGVVHCLSVKNGNPLWKYDDTKGHIFSSFSIKCNKPSDWDLLFGCHDSGIYCLSLQQNHVKLKWRTQLTAPVYSTPCYFLESSILAVSNDGKLAVIESKLGNITLTHALPGETFSSPVALNEQIFIGCRDDKIYCLCCSVR